MFASRCFNIIWNYFPKREIRSCGPCSRSCSALAAFIAAGYIALTVLLYVTQERSIFFPGLNDTELRAKFAARRIEITTPSATIEELVGRESRCHERAGLDLLRRQRGGTSCIPRKRHPGSTLATCW